MKIKKVLRFEVENVIRDDIRLDKWLAQYEELGSRTYVLGLIKQGLVFINGKKVTKSSFCVSSGITVEVHIPEPPKLELVGNDLPLDIVFEDQDLIVVDKPAGLVVHPSLGHFEDSLVHRLLGHCQLSSGSSEERPGVVHRLDKETSGLIVLAKNDFAHRHLSEQFKQKKAFRVYEAICLGLVKPKQGTIQSYLNRHPTDRKKRASVRDQNKKIIRDYFDNFEKGKWAVTHFQVLAYHELEPLTLLELKLETGRTHQIRVHLSELGYPIVGDELYGADKSLGRLKSVKLRSYLLNFNRVLLHAKQLGFVHPREGQSLTFRRDWPNPIKELRESLFFDK